MALLRKLYKELHDELISCLHEANTFHLYETCGLHDQMNPMYSATAQFIDILLSCVTMFFVPAS